MKNSISGLSVAALALAVGVLAGGAANAADTQTFNADTDAGVSDFGVPGFSDLPFVGEWRIGNAGLSGDHELKVGTNTAAPSSFDQGQFAWGNGQAVGFSLTYDGSSATATLGGASTTFTVGSPSAFNALLIRTATPGTGTSVVLSNLALDGTALNGGGFSNDYDSDAADSDRLVKWLGVSNAGDLASGFSLTGDVTLNWTGSQPTGSNLAFQIKAAEGPAQVPVPATLALMGVGLAGLGAIAARRRRA